MYSLRTQTLTDRAVLSPSRPASAATFSTACDAWEGRSLSVVLEARRTWSLGSAESVQRCFSWRCVSVKLLPNLWTLSRGPAVAQALFLASCLIRPNPPDLPTLASRTSLLAKSQLWGPHGASLASPGPSSSSPTVEAAAPAAASWAPAARGCRLHLVLCTVQRREVERRPRARAFTPARAEAGTKDRWGPVWTWRS